MTGDMAAHGLAADTGTVDEDNPWPGLVTFREGDQAFFHGRSAESDALLRRVLHARLTILFGLSGLGKSSLLFAGVFPRLRRENVFPVYVRLDFSSSSPDLVAQVKAAIAAEAAATGVEAPAPRPDETLWEYFHRDGADFWSRRNRLLVPLLVFDQFEEIFTLGRVDAARGAASETLLIQLADLVEGRPPASLKARLDADPQRAHGFTFGRHEYKVLLSLREDYLAELEGLGEIMSSIGLNRFRLRRMNGDAALRVVTEAAKARDLIEPAVAEQVVRFVAASKVADAPLDELELEPALLSVVCRELNLKRRNRGEARISVDLLEGTQEEILTDFYERSLGDQAPEVRTFIEEQLLTASGFRSTKALEDALNEPGVTEDAISTLVERRLLRLEDRLGTRHVELMHDVLTGVAREGRERNRREKTIQEREQAARERRRRLVVRAASVAVFVLVAMLALVAGFWRSAVHEREIAEEQRAMALEAHSEAEAQRQIAIAAQAEAETQRSLALARQLAAESTLSEEPATSMLLATESLKRATTLAGYTAWARAMDGLPASSALMEHGGASAVATSLDGRWLATAVRRKGEKPTVIVWDRGSGVVAESLEHSRPVTAMAFSPDGTLLATVGNGATARLWTWRTKQVMNTLPRQRSVKALAFSPDGSWLATASGKTVSVWPLASEAPPRKLDHEGAVGAVAFSPDGRWLATASGHRGRPAASNSVQIWDWMTEAQRARFEHDAPVRAVAFSPDGERLASGGDDVDRRAGEAQLWEWDSDNQPARFDHDAPVHSVLFSPGGQWLLTTSGQLRGRSGEVRLWNVQSGLQRFQLALAGRMAGAAFGPGGDWLVTATSNQVRIWELRDLKRLSQRSLRQAIVSDDGTRLAIATVGGKAIMSDVRRERPPVTLAHQGPVRAMALSADGTRAATASERSVQPGEAALWDAATRTVLRRWPFDQWSNDVAFSPDGTRLATAGRDKAITLWDLVSGRKLATLQVGYFLSDVAFSADGTRLAAASDDNSARVWDLNSNEEIARFEHDDEVWAVDFHPGGARLASGSKDKTARIWDLGSGAELARLQHDDPVGGVAFSPDGTRLASASRDNKARLWDWRSGRELLALPHRGFVHDVNFSPDGKWLATGSEDKVARIWNLGSATEAARLERDAAVRAVDFSPDGTILAIASMSGSGPPGATGGVRLWQWDSARPPTRLEHDLSVHSVAFSPDGTRLATAGRRQARRIGEARIWDATTGKALVHLPDDLFARVAALSPDGTRLATSTPDKTVQVWDAATGEELARRQFENRVQEMMFSPAGRQLAIVSGVSGGRGGRLHLWDWAQGRAPSSLDAERVSGMAYSRDGSRLATGSRGRTAQVWDVGSKTALASVDVARSFRGLAFNADGTRLATLSGNTVTVWDWGSGQAVAWLEHGASVLDAVFDAGGERLVSVDREAVVRDWPWRTEDLIDQACSRVPGNLSRAQWRTHLGNEAFEPTCPGLPDREK